MSLSILSRLFSKMRGGIYSLTENICEPMATCDFFSLCYFPDPPWIVESTGFCSVYVAHIKKILLSELPISNNFSIKIVLGRVKDNNVPFCG